MSSKRVGYASLGALAAQMAGLFSPPGSSQQPFNEVVLDSARGNLANELAKAQAEKEKKKNGGVLGAITGAAKGGLQGFALGGPVGAAAGAGLGGFQGYNAPKSTGSQIADIAAAMQFAKSGQQPQPAAAAPAVNMNPAVPKEVQAMLPAAGQGTVLQPQAAQATPASNWSNILAGLSAAGGMPRRLNDGSFVIDFPY